MQQHWFHTVWPFVGAGAAIVMVAILLTTDTFRSNTTVSRWRDAVWLAWLAAPLYWVHQLEEYSLPVIGLPYSLPACAIRGPYRGKVVGAAFAAVAVTHAVLFLGYGLFKAGVIGNAGLLVYAAAVGFTPIILAALASRFFTSELLRPVSALSLPRV